jgi:hypothetical protein
MARAVHAKLPSNLGLAAVIRARSDGNETSFERWRFATLAGRSSRLWIAPHVRGRTGRGRHARRVRAGHECLGILARTSERSVTAIPSSRAPKDNRPCALDGAPVNR